MTDLAEALERFRRARSYAANADTDWGVAQLAVQDAEADLLEAIAEWLLRFTPLEERR